MHAVQSVYGIARNERASTERARLSLAGVRIAAEVESQSSDEVVLAQELPLFSLGTEAVAHDGRTARISAVSVEMRGETPVLRVELTYDREPSRFSMPVPIRRRRQDETVSYERPSSIPPARPIIEARAPATSEAPALEARVVVETQAVEAPIGELPPEERQDTTEDMTLSEARKAGLGLRAAAPDPLRDLGRWIASLFRDLRALLVAALR